MINPKPIDNLDEAVDRFNQVAMRWQNFETLGPDDIDWLVGTLSAALFNMVVDRELREALAPTHKSLIGTVYDRI